MRRRRLVYLLPVSRSTNVLAHRLVGRGRVATGDMVWARHQTAGRGRFQRQWHSPPGGGLYATWIFKPHWPAAQAEGWLRRVAGAVHFTVASLLNTNTVRIKPPNDIYVGSRKIAGILIENQVHGKHILTSIVGIGINVNLSMFPRELQPKATSLRLEAGRPFRMSPVINTLQHNLFAFLQASTQWADRYYFEFITMPHAPTP